MRTTAHGTPAQRFYNLLCIGVDSSDGSIAYARDRTRNPRALFKTASMHL
jgi:hypothetical protein